MGVLRAKRRPRVKGAFKALRKGKGGYRVIAKSTGKALSKKPLGRATALAQLRAVEFHKHNPGRS
jgi:hypothetical protein